MKIRTNTLEIMTDDEYVDREGYLCPVCRSEEIQVFVENSSGKILTVTNDCDKCNSQWEDEYLLVRYNLIKLADEGVINEE